MTSNFYSKSAGSTPNQGSGKMLVGSRLESAKFRLFCFAPAGMGACQYISWKGLVPRGVEVLAVQLPGHETRLGEPLIDDCDQLILQIADTLTSYTDLPYALWGHSLGALLAFELSREFRRRKIKSPELLCVAACRAPHKELELPKIQHLSDSAFISEIIGRYGSIPPEVLQEEDLLKTFTRILRADFTIWERYAYTHEQPLSCELLVFGGDKDFSVKSEELMAWRSQTVHNFSVHMLSGGHFFVQPNRHTILQEVTKRIRLVQS